MTLALIVRRGLRQHLLSTVVTALSIALAGGLLMSVWAVKVQSQTVFTQMNIGFDAVLGARGSKLQLVLNSIFDLEASPGNVSSADYQYIKHHPAVKRAIPIAVGDNLRGYRIVGTLDELFIGVEYAPGKHFELEPGGRLFNEKDPSAKEAVIGSFAARKLGLKVGDTFHPFHGLSYNPMMQHTDIYTVAGILKPTNTPVDRVVWIPLHGLQTMNGHDPKYATDVSAVLIQLRSPSAGFPMDMMYNRQGDRLTFAWPISAIVSDLFARIGWIDKALGLIAYLVALVSAAGVLVAIYNSMAARRRDIAILRALGARRRTVFGAIVLEAAAIGAMGMIVSFAVYLGIFGAVTAIVRTQTGVVLNPFTYDPVMLWATAGMIALCALGGIVPAWKAYGTDVAENLSPAFLMSRRMLRALLFLAVPVFLAGGCSRSRNGSQAIGQFHHQAPHGGTIVGLGDDYNLELVRDASAGTLSAYVFDDDMENFIRISPPSITVLADTGGVLHRLVLEAVANPATGETVGSTSFFQAQADWLKTAPRFHAELPLVAVRGTEFKNLSFDFPEGSDKD